MNRPPYFLWRATTVWVAKRHKNQGPIGLYPLDHHGDALADADAHRCHSVAPASAT